MATLADLDFDIFSQYYFPATTQERNTMSKNDVEKNFKFDWSDYETLDEARLFAKRSTARNMTEQSIWQRIEKTVVPQIDIVINPVDVTTEPVKA